MKPLVSVSMPCFNSAHTLPMALASLVAQTYENWECLLVDDGSTDDPYAIVEQVNDPRIRYFRLPQNMGRPAARQRALEEARGEFLSMLDSDDWLFPNRLQVLVNTLTQHPAAVAVFSRFCLVDVHGRISGVKGSGTRSILKAENAVQMPGVSHAGHMVRSEATRGMSFDLRLGRSQDIDFLYRVLRGRQYVTIPDITYAYSMDYHSEFNRVAQDGYQWERLRMGKHLATQPVTARIHIARSYLKAGV
ncbi:MAG: glycosyltransferase family 2 protein, partial [Desulfatibacillaceae bacterium]